VVVCAAALAGIGWGRVSNAGEGDRVATDLHPYVVPVGYVDHGGRELSRPLGHDLNVALVFDLGASVQSATAADLRALGLSVERAHEVALENLERLAERGDVRMAMFPGPDSRPFVLVGGHWAAATSILLPDLAGTGTAVALGTRDVCASIPHRDAMLIFACGDRAYRDAMRAFVREKESGGSKPLTFGLFRLTDAGVVPLDE
jgi:hypothetical protein